jgi:hypothetical protein
MSEHKKLLIQNKWEYVVPVLAITSLLVSCIIVSSKKFFWNDELFSYYFLADPSFTHMLGAFHDKLNNTPLLYFILGWLWVRLFDSTELSLRLFSSLGMCTACAITWITLRRTYNFWSTSIGVLSIFCTSSLILSQNSEARMYGLFLAVCSLGLLQYDSLNRNSNSTWKALIPNILIHAAIVNTHLFGLFFSIAMACALIVRDKYIKIFRPKVYLSFLLGILSIILYIPAFINQADAGNPRTWIPIPTLKDLVDVFSFSLLTFEKTNLFSFTKFTLLLLVILISGKHILLRETDSIQSFQTTNKNYKNSKAELSLFIFAYAFLTVPVFVWIVSVTVKPIFFDRYLIPSVLSWSILITYVSSLIISNSNFVNEILNRLRVPNFFISKWKTLFLLVLSIVLLIQPIMYATNVRSTGTSIQIQQRPGLNDNKYGYKELPIAVPYSHDFLERFYYSSERDRYFFILDWSVALDPTSGLFSTQQYKHLEAWKRSYPKVFKNNIIKSENFLNKYKRFLVLSSTNYTKKCNLEKTLKNGNGYCPRWLEMRIVSDPNYQVTLLGDIDNKVFSNNGDIRKLYLVEKVK